MFILLLCLLVSSLFPASVRAQSSNDPIYVFHTNLGDIHVQLFPDITPQTVANFLRYVNRGAYTNSLFHRSVPSFIVQGGGYTLSSQNQIVQIPADPPVVNEYHLPNVRGTIAMAKLGGSPNSATCEWFFNTVDNTNTLGISNNSGFTVFGRITDAAGLAVMDRIAAVPHYDASTTLGSAFSEIPLVAYSSAQGIQANNLVLVNSITALPTWSGTSVSMGGDGSSRLLWTNKDGTAAVWKVNPQGQLVTQQQFGPYANWTARAIATGKDNNTHLLWNNTDGTASVYLLNSANSKISQLQYGPYANWTAQGIATAPNNTVRLLWTNTDGTASIYTLDANNNKQGQQQYGPTAGLTARAVTVGADGLTRLLWTDTNEKAYLWRLNAQGSLQDQQSYGPFAGWRAQSVVSAPDGSLRIVWAYKDDHIALWTVAGNGMMTGQTQYGPYNGFRQTSISVGSDGNARLLWDNINGQSALWSLKPEGSFASNYSFGPY